MLPISHFHLGTNITLKKIPNYLVYVELHHLETCRNFLSPMLYNTQIIMGSCLLVPSVSNIYHLALC